MKPERSAKKELKHDSEAELQMNEDETIQKICAQIGIQTIECIQTENGKCVHLRPKSKWERDQLRIAFEATESPITIVNVVRRKLQQLTELPIPIEGIESDHPNLTNEAMGEEDTPGKSNDEILYDIVRSYDGNCRLIHAWHKVTHAIELFDIRRIAGNSERIGEIEESISDHRSTGDRIISYWWALDVNEENRLHIVYEVNDQNDNIGSNEESLEYPMLLKEIEKKLKAEGIGHLVFITNDEDIRNGTLFAGQLDADDRDDESESATSNFDNSTIRYETSNVDVSTSINGILIEEYQLNEIIERIKETLREQEEQGEALGVNLVIGNCDEIESIESEYESPVTLSWEVRCYKRIPNTMTTDEKREILRSFLYFDEEVLNFITDEEIQGMKIVDTTTLLQSPSIEHVQVTWSKTENHYAYDYEIEALSYALQQVRQQNDTEKVNIAILDADEENDGKIILRIGISPSEESYE